MSTMNTTGAPPLPPSPAPQPPTPQPPAPGSSTARVVAIVAIVLGALIVVGGVTSAVLSTLLSGSQETTSRSIAVDGVDALSADLNAGSLRVEFSDVDDAQLTVTSTFRADQWTLRRDGSELVVAAPDGRFHWWGGWFGHGNGEAVLQLPQSLAGLDVNLDQAAGTLTVEGDFGDLEATVGAGRLTVSGSAQSVSADLSAGDADIRLSGVRTADLEVSAGDIDATLTGAQPDQVKLSASAGAMNVTVPAGEYDVTSQLSAGSFDNRIGSTPGASSTVDVDVSAGHVVLRSGR